MSKEDYELMEKYTYALFARGTEMAAQKGLILVDTKYEFGKRAVPEAARVLLLRW